MECTEELKCYVFKWVLFFSVCKQWIAFYSALAYVLGVFMFVRLVGSALVIFVIVVNFVVRPVICTLKKVTIIVVWSCHLNERFLKMFDLLEST